VSFTRRVARRPEETLKRVLASRMPLVSVTLPLQASSRTAGQLTLTLTVPYLLNAWLRTVALAAASAILNEVAAGMGSTLP
jgi:hypothetical protein